MLDSYEHRIVWMRYPGGEVLGRLVVQPLFQNRRIVPMIGDAQFRYRASDHLTGAGCIFKASISDFHSWMVPAKPLWRPTRRCGYPGEAD